MNWLSSFLKSSIGKKLLMALTGLFLCTFLVVHLTGNLQLFKNDNGLAFNEYAVFMTTNPLIKFTSYGLYATILFHAFWGIYLVYDNKKARPVAYAQVDGKANSGWASRNMGLLGTIILVFIVLHMTGFWAKYKFGEVPYTKYHINTTDGEIKPFQYDGDVSGKIERFSVEGFETVVVKNLYIIVEDAFSNWWVVLIYVLAMLALSFHLIHGFSSAFQTLGLNHKKYNQLIKNIGIGVFGIIIPLLFASMPIFFLIKFLFNL
jgi:succinate dehydrogenase / fumarate reductase, cytochrome b subunit